MFRLVHISDPHLGPLPAASLRELASKRVLGYINWHRHRAASLKDEVIRQLISAVHASRPDHVAVTGDLVNIALTAELVPARKFLEEIGPPEHVTVVPGNHDAYVPGAVARATKVWEPFLLGDKDIAAPDWPTVRERHGLSIIGVNTARASGPFMATGHVSNGQALRLEQRLELAGDAGLFRVVLIHHPPIRGSTAWHKRLIGGSRVRNAVRQSGAELILHGHTHLATEMEIAGPAYAVPTISVPSASQAPLARKPAAGFNVFDISRASGGWTVAWSEQRLNDKGTGFYTARSRTWIAAPNVRPVAV